MHTPSIRPILRKLIRTGIGRFRFLMGTVGMGVAVLFILLAVQTFMNFNELLHGKQNANETADFLVINKEVTAATQGRKELSAFNEAELDSLRQQPFVEKLGTLTASNFNVNVSSYSDAIPFYTDAYFESVPDEFIDVTSEAWAWKPGQRDLPVIIPTFIIDLYNTGMAMSSQNFPQLSLEALKAIPLRVLLKGNGKEMEMVGHIVASSDRLNSILIPQSFMEAANRTLGYRTGAVTTRIVIKTKDPSDPQLVKYLADRGWRTNTDKTRFSKVRVIVNWIVGIVGGIGLVMLLFGMLVFSLFIQLTIASSKRDIELLKTLGASPRQLQAFLMQQFMPVNGVVMLAVVGGLSVIQWVLHRILLGQQMYIPPYVSVATLAAMILVLGLIWLTNRGTVRRYLKD
ncbi:MAG: hypothetical protein MUF29_03665 [Chitinophagaceae bacterium]|jgi:hypothetical protein|nr:hypothetical protein [Chitinophagaceae bacterium]